VQLHQERGRHLQQRQEQRREQDQPTEAPYNNPHLLFNGNLKNDLGESVEDAQIQFWHADFHGKYLHPNEDLEGKELMKDSFSYFGTATTDSNGDFDFKTYRPGIYVSRPITHIHFKVFHDGQELLTSQFYFEDENVGRWYDKMVILQLEEGVDDEDGSVVLTTSKQVVVNMRMGGRRKLTPRDVEGPFYPLVDFFDVGNDMTSGLLEKVPVQIPSNEESKQDEIPSNEESKQDELTSRAVDETTVISTVFENENSKDQLDSGGNDINGNGGGFLIFSTVFIGILILCLRV